MLDLSSGAGPGQADRIGASPDSVSVGWSTLLLVTPVSWLEIIRKREEGRDFAYVR